MHDHKYRGAPKDGHCDEIEISGAKKKGIVVKQNYCGGFKRRLLGKDYNYAVDLKEDITLKFRDEIVFESFIYRLVNETS